MKELIQDLKDIFGPVVPALVMSAIVWSIVGLLIIFGK